jgi:endonuclease YncB( thermonuclease family)
MAESEIDREGEAPVIPLLLAAVLSGPIPCEVVRVVDGDTVEARCHTWIGTDTTTFVRVRGIDTPEKAPRAKCPAEAALAAKASKFTVDALPSGTPVVLSAIDNDKFGGRVDAVVTYNTPLIPGRNLADDLIAAGLARPYHGEAKKSWCGP